MDPHEDLVAANRAHIDAHYADIAAKQGDTPEPEPVELAAEDQAVLDAQTAVDEADAKLIEAQQVAYKAKIEREKQAELDAIAASEAEKTATEEDKQVDTVDADDGFVDDQEVYTPPVAKPRQPMPAAV